MAHRTIAGRYELEELLGGSTWRAVDAELGRQVVVRLSPRVEEPTTLTHPNIARVFDQGEENGERYVVREFLPGGSLAARTALGEREAHDVASAIASSLVYAHAQGVTHGALRPACVLFDAEGRAKVVGFGAGGTPEADVRAFGVLLQSLEPAAPTLRPLALAALAGELDAAELVERLGAAEPAADVVEPTTLVLPPPSVRRRLPLPFGVGAALVLLAAGVGAAFLASSGGDNMDEPATGSLSLPAPTASTAPGTAEPEPPPSTTATTTTAAPTTAGTTELQPTIAPPPPATTAPPATTEELPPTTTEEPAPTTTEETTTETASE